MRSTRICLPMAAGSASLVLRGGLATVRVPRKRANPNASAPRRAVGFVPGGHTLGIRQGGILRKGVTKNVTPLPRLLVNNINDTE